ncbi:stringent starvation protein B [Franzmannia pantelleriensis]|uniref:Stringent starvation protein B n=1 Tax=Franzmannia pantelleriensis TaxID=48727 RepID=A0A1G9NM82_9GAMM|nr:ClpXP protease specificity-enhancing factor [Halomonas pantelleriensis]SDL87489.1 stringent starvation protein B [Halomonas pantelleriensis]
MLSSRPYLARALYQWLLDNDQTPYIVVDAEHADVAVPRQFVQNGQIVLNVAPTAVRDLMMENEAITFNARFGGQPMQVVVPSQALIALYARENGVGMVFGHEPVMPGFEAEVASDEAASEDAASPSLSSVDAESPGGEQDDETGEESGAPPKGRPSLRVIK